MHIQPAWLDATLEARDKALEEHGGSLPEVSVFREVMETKAF